MKIQFCDLCSESVPEADFSLGRAFRRQGRIVCAACDSSMTSSGASAPKGPFSPGGAVDATRLSAGVGPGSHTALATKPAPDPVGAAPPLPQHRAGPGWVSILAVGLVLGASWFFSGKLQVLQAASERSQANLSQEVQRLGESLDAISLKSQERSRKLEDRLGMELNRSNTDRAKSTQELRDELARMALRLGDLDQKLARISTSQQEGVIDNGRRLDDFLAQSMKFRVELREIASRLARAESSPRSPSTAVTPGASAPPQKPLAYAAQLVDLKSDVPQTRWSAVSSLGETGDPAVVPHLLPFLNDSNSFVRMAVARVLGDLKSPLGIEPLIGTLEDDEVFVREAAMAALRIITGRNFRFDPYGKTGERKKWVGAWRSWWAKSSQDFVGGM